MLLYYELRFYGKKSIPMLNFFFLSLTTVFLSLYSFSTDTLKIEKEIYNQINTYRTKIGKSKLTYSSENVKSCRNHSLYMGTNWILVHVSSLEEVNARAEIIQLNTTMNQNEIQAAKSVLDIFIKSLPHKKIIESDFKEISVGVYTTADEDLWVTVRFY
jgi:uncharacterized protein YkwD